MSQTSENSESQRRRRFCPQCGTELPGDAPAEFCPKCLLATALATKSEASGGTVPFNQGPPKLGPQLLSGQVFGHYKIIRALGGGGMGCVYEAEDLDNNRRVALKILSHKLDSPEARERFFREGRLAAAINHPNSVYIFGTEEVAGTPVISMELLSGGTLQDIVQKRGPMRPGDAVDAVLQIIDGLEAAQRSGILHRDIKPSNCFVDANGTVKIGDFGLSISTAVRTEPALTADGAFLGTPAFCPPEQLRGEELNARSDIYSVGATLFYLLTGRTPFEAQNVVALIATVLEKPSPSPRALRPEAPDGLARVVQRCLQKVRGDRYASYAELKRALEPFSSAAPVPAPLGLRFLAGLLDFLTLNFCIQVAVLIFFGGLMNLIEAVSKPDLKTTMYIVAATLVGVLYYGVFEGFFGAAAGKAVCRLRVVETNRNRPGFWRATARAFVYTALPVLPFWIVCALMYEGNLAEFLRAPKVSIQWGAMHPTWFRAMSATPYVGMALLFVTARRRNGFRAVHDILTSTRVIVSARSVVPTSVAGEREPGPVAVNGQSATLVGPYQIIATLADSPGCRWLVGFDLRLLRKVWIRQLPPGAEPFPLHLRNIGRPGRLRWLTGKRSETEAWDAFEAPGGQAFVAVAVQPQPWERVRFWLWELAQELAFAVKDGTAPRVLSPERVWITGDGKTKLLDFPAPGVDAGESSLPPPDRKPQEFLAQLGAAALTGNVNSPAHELSLPLPLHARRFIIELPSAIDPSMVLIRLGPLLRFPAAVTRLRRGALVLGCVAFPLLMAGASIIGKQFLQEFGNRYPQMLEVYELLSVRQGMKFGPRVEQVTDTDFAVLISSRYRSFVTNQATWNSPLASMLITGEQRKFAEKSIAEFPNPTPEQIEHAEKAIKPPSIGDIDRELGNLGFYQIVFHSTLLIYVCIPAIVAALLFRGGLAQLLARIVYVKRNGARASRLRVFLRSVVAWAPVVTATTMSIAAVGTHKAWFGIPAVMVMVLLSAISLCLPLRGLQDRIAGTFPVPK